MQQAVIFRSWNPSTVISLRNKNIVAGTNNIAFVINQDDDNGNLNALVLKMNNKLHTTVFKLRNRYFFIDRKINKFAFDN